MAAFRAGLAAVARSASLASVSGRRVGPAWLLPCTGVRAAHDLPPSLMPGPYPKTPEEWTAAAKKYNLPLEDYKPYPDDGMGYGDYPMLPNKSQEEKDPWYSWDHPDLRRNWGETMHLDFDKYLRNRVDTSPTPVPINRIFKALFKMLFFLGFIVYLGEKFPMYPPAALKQYPYNNLYLERGGDPNQPPPEVKNYVFK